MGRKTKAVSICPKCRATCVARVSSFGLWLCNACGAQWPQGCGPQPYEEKRKRHQTADGAGRKR